MITVKEFGDGWDMATAHDVVSNLRDEDAYEFRAAGVVDPVEDTSHYLASAHHPLMVFYRERPTFIFGTIKARNNIHCLFGFGTAGTRRIIPHLTKWGKRVWIPWLFETQGANRVEVRLPVASTQSFEWLTSNGMRIDGLIKHGSATGEPLVQLSYTVDEYRNLKHEKSYVQDQRSYSTGRNPGTIQIQ